MDDAIQAIMMAFSVIVFVIAFTIALFMFSQVASTSEILTQYADTTRFYDNIELIESAETLDKAKNGRARIVDSATVIPTLYRYYKENFCVKIYDSTDRGTVVRDNNQNNEIDFNNLVLLQIFDVNLEGEVNKAASDTKAKDSDIASSPNPTDDQIKHNALNHIYNVEDSNLYMFGAPWIGSTENMKTRIDYFITGKAGYINNQYVDYTSNGNENTNFFSEAIHNKDNYQFIEEFISYSYSGETIETEEGDTLVTGAASKDKIVIRYTIMYK